MAAAQALLSVKGKKRAMVKEEQHFVHIYTGNGKGKTTAALGLAVRAAGAGKRTAFIQWMKSGFPYSEYRGLEPLGEWIVFHRFGGDDFRVCEKLGPLYA